MSSPMPDASEGDRPAPQPQLLDSPQNRGALFQNLPSPLSGRVGLILVAAALLGAAVWSSGIFRQNPPENLVGAQQASLSHHNSTGIVPVAKDDWEQAIGRLMASDADKAKVRSGLHNGTLRLGTITVSDFDAEDGDWVAITGAGVRQDIRLFKKPLTVTIPYLPGGTVSVLGLVDGGGGNITVSIHVGAAGLPLRAIKPGEAVQIPTP